MERIVKSIKKVETEKVYDITVEGEHHYILHGGIVSHNSGLKYSASSILFLSKKKEKDGTEVIGNIIKVKAQKSRFTKENSLVETRLYYDSRGLDKYYGLVELGSKHGVFEVVGNRVKIAGGTAYPSVIYKEPEKYFTPEILQALDECAKKEFLYGVVDGED